VIDKDYNREIADTARVAREIASAILDKRPLSIISLCDGESATLWAGKGFGTFHYLAGRGFPGEIGPVAEQLAAALAKTDIICVPRSGGLARMALFAPNNRETIRLWDIRLKKDALIGDAMVCWYLLFDMWLPMMLQDRRVLVVNNEADKVCVALDSKTIPGTPTNSMAEWWPPDWVRTKQTIPIILKEGIAGSEQALSEARDLTTKVDWPDICLIGAGARTAHLAVNIAEMFSIPVVELGAAITWLYEPVLQDNYVKMLDLYRREG